MKKYKVELFSPFTGTIVRTDIIHAERYSCTHGGYTPGDSWTFFTVNNGSPIASYPTNLTIITLIS